MEVAVTPAQSGCACKVEIQVTNTNDDKLVLHWGGIRDRKNEWILPSHKPEGTWVQNGALRTPFQKSGSSSSLKIEIDDPAIQGIEFLIFNEARNIWFKNNGDNFHVRLPSQAEQAQSISVPEDLVKVQAYLRWERRGKQMYTPEQEKVTATLSLAAAASSGGIAVLYFDDLGGCTIGDECQKYQLSVAFAFLSWITVFISSIIMFWLLAAG